MGRRFLHWLQPTTYVSVRVLRYVGLFCGVLGMLVNGVNYSFDAFELALKATFNYTQSNTAVVSSLGNVGISIGLLPGWFYGRFGSIWTCVVSLVVPTLGYLLMYLSLLSKQFYSHNAWLFGIWYLIAGVGALFYYFAALMFAMENFPEKHRGKMVGLMDASVGASAAVFSAIYGARFVNGHDNGDEEQQNMGGFFILVAVAFAFTSLLGILFLRDYGLDDKGTSQRRKSYVRFNNNDVVPPPQTPRLTRFPTISVGSGDSSTEVEPGILPELASIEEPDISLTGRALLKRPDFQFLFWMFLLATSTSLTILNYITTILKSFGHEAESTLFTIIIPVSSASCRLGSGWLSDMLLMKLCLPRELIMMVTLCIYTVVLVCAMFYADCVAMLVVLSIATGMEFGSQWCLVPTVMSERFGLRHMGINWGATMIGTAATGFAVQYTFNGILDYYTRALGLDNSCNDLVCYRWSFLLLAGITGCAAVLCAGLLTYSWRDARKK